MKTSDNQSQGQFVLLQHDRDALEARLALIEQAQHNICLQTYIWNEDDCGQLIAKSLVAAADRGVKVRLLLDDFNTSNELKLFRRLDAHPYISIKLFNPIPKSWRQGLVRWLKLVWEIRRLNRRMHNKALLIDQQYGIVGGRNIGNEYFGFSNTFNFIDRDILCQGTILDCIQDSFNSYWRHSYAKPIKRWYLSKRRRHFLKRLEELRNYQIQHTGLLQLLSNSRQIVHWQQSLDDSPLVMATMVVDSPDYFTTADLIPRKKEVARYLQTLLNHAKVSISIESAYLVLTDSEIELLAEKRCRGISVELLTNSLATNDVLANHAGFINTRRALLSEKIAPHELALKPVDRQSLHSKSVIIDHQTLFIGSYNLNERSALLNSELAITIFSPELSTEVEQSVSKLVAESWTTTSEGIGNKIHWHKLNGEHSSHEPDSHWWQRIVAKLLSRLTVSRYF